MIQKFFLHRRIKLISPIVIYRHMKISICWSKHLNPKRDMTWKYLLNTKYKYFLVLKILFNNFFQDGPGLSYEKFHDILTDTGLLSIEQESLSEKSFLKAQLTPPRHWELEELVFVEFLEALSRIALSSVQDKE